MNPLAPPRRRRHALSQALALALAVPFSMTAFAQDQSSDEDEGDSSEQEMSTVNVVGSRIKRSQTEGPAPVVVISREDFEREGFKTVGDALQTIAQNTTASFTGDLAVNGFSPNAQVVNLRNLGPGYTLTLINGRRPAQYPQPYNRDNNVVNVRAIPSSIIESIEILSGGASAIYGSDAVAGVVNIVLRKDYDGHLLRGIIGTTDEGGGDSYGAEFSGGLSGDRWSVTYALQYGNDDPVFASDREFLSDLRNGPLGPALTNPQLALINIRLSNPQPGSALNQNAYYPGAAVCDRFGYTTVTTAARGTYCGGFTQPAARSISNAQEFYSGYSYWTFDLTDDIEAFGSFTYYDQSSASSSGTEFWGTAGDQFLLTRTGARTSSYFDPQVGGLVQLQRIFNPFELGGPQAVTTNFDETTFEFTAGLRGTFGDAFDWEALAGHGEYDYTADRPRLLSQALHDYFLGPLIGFGGALPNTTGNFPIYNLNRDRWNTPFTPEQYRSVSTRVVNEGTTTSSNFAFSVVGDVYELPAGPVGFAGILEFDRQTVDLRSDPRTNQLRPLDNQTIFNLTSSGRTEGDRNRYAIGAEFRIPIFEPLTGTLAARYDRYDDLTAVDGAATINAGLEWRPVESLLLRSTFATSFRAPDAQLVFAEGAASFSTILDDYVCRSGIGLGLTRGPRTRTQCNVSGDPTIYSTQTVIAGNPLLEEEKGYSFTYGFVWDITDDLSWSVDYYRIKLKDAAVQLSAATLLDREASCRLGVRPDGQPYEFSLDSALCQNVISLITRESNPGTALDQRIVRINSAYINSALSDNSGIDSTLRYRYDTDRWGVFNVDMAYSLVLTDKFKESDLDALVDFRDNPANLNQRSRVRGSVSWRLGDWTTTVFGTRYGSNGSAAQASGTNAAGQPFGRRLSPYMLYNLSVQKRFGENIDATFAVINVTDNQYRFDHSNTGYPFFNNFIGADPLGRRYNLSVRYRF